MTLVNGQRRSLLRYLGGKTKLAPWIVRQFGDHRTYCEPYAGAASVLLAKRRSYAEVLNDLSDDIVTLFRVLQDTTQSKRLIELVQRTPFAMSEFRLAYEAHNCPVERSRRMLIRSFMGYGTSSLSCLLPHSRTGFRSNVARVGTIPASDWASYPAVLAQIIERLHGVVIDSRPALRVIEIYDSPEALIYCDPPYVQSTRNIGSNKDLYAVEMTDYDHRELANLLHHCRGAVFLSGYDCDLYAELYRDWHKVTRTSWAQGAKRRTECLWMNAKAQQAPQGGWLQ